MQKSLFILIATLLLATQVDAQSKSKRKKEEEQTKSYVSAILNIDTEDFTVETRAPSNMGIFTNLRTYLLPRSTPNIGFAFQKEMTNNLYHEIALTQLSRSKHEFLSVSFRNIGEPDTLVTTGNIIILWDIGARYEYGKYLFPSQSKINVGLGVAAAPKFLHSLIDPRISNDFTSKTLRANLNITIVPSLKFDITKQLSIIVKAIPTLFNLEYDRTRIDNPILTERQQMNNEFGSSFFTKQHHHQFTSQI